MSDSDDYSDSDDEQEIIDEQTMNPEHGEHTILDDNQFDVDILEGYTDNINLLFHSGELTDYEFQIQHLLIKYNKLISHYTFDFDESNELKMQELKLFEDDYKKKLINFQIDENTFYKQEYKRLKATVEILEESKTIEEKHIKIDKELDTNSMLDKYIKHENTNLKKIAKEKGIDWPKEISKTDEKGKSPDQIKDLKDKYLKDLDKAHNEAKEYMSGYILKPMKSDGYAELNQYIEIKPKTLLKTIMKEDKSNTNPVMIDSVNKLIMDDLKIKLKKISIESLFKCIDKNHVDINYKTSYIEKLKQNKVSVLKFNKYPGQDKDLKEILLEEAKNYRLSSSNLLTSDFISSFNEDELETTKSHFNVTKQVKINDKMVDTEGSFLLKIKKESNQDISNKIKYKQNGLLISLSFKKEFFDKQNNLEILDEKHFDIIKPIPDDLYNELQEQELLNNGKYTKIIKVWELHINVVGIQNKIIRRYNEFTDYLKDLRKLLSENMTIFEDNKNIISANILHTKIKKIDYFLEKNEDGEYEIEGIYSVDNYIKKNPFILEQRENGIALLNSYILQIYPDNHAFIKSLENELYNYSNKDYMNNIHKLLFIFKNYKFTFIQYINAELSLVEIMEYEILPNIIKDDEIEILNKEYVNEDKTLNSLKTWKPPQDEYMKYKEDLDILKNDIIEFTESYPELSNLQIKNIIFEMNDYKKWDKTLTTLEIQKFKNIKNKITFLKKERNKLLCRRIFRVATINERLQTKTNLFNKYSKCKDHDTKLESINIDDLSDIIENIIYNYSKKPKDYKTYSDLIITQAPLVCDEIDNYINIIPIIIEFIIKEGDISLINIKRIELIISENEFKEDYIKEYLENFRESDLIVYRNALISQANQQTPLLKLQSILLKAIQNIIHKKKQDQIDYEDLITSNIYIPPIETNSKPELNSDISDYIIINDNKYIYGGYFPSFISTVDNSTRNYNDQDLYILANILELEYELFKGVDDAKDLYSKCMELLRMKSTEMNIKYPIKEIIEYHPPIITMIKNTSFVNYYIRPRIGVKEPGHAYNVLKDEMSREYAVPFKYSIDLLPVYNMDFKDSLFYIIQGPCLYEISDKSTFITSSFYIIIEYIDNYNKTKKFREGINVKNMKKTPKKTFDSCNIYIKKENCNDENTYSIDGLKCKYIDDKCTSVKLEQFDIIKKTILFTDIVFKKPNGNTNIYKTKLWTEAIQSSVDYIYKTHKIKKLTDLQIIELAEEQKIKLLTYSEFLQNLNIKTFNKKLKTFNKKLETISEYFDVFDFLQFDKKKEGDGEGESDGDRESSSEGEGDSEGDGESDGESSSESDGESSSESDEESSSESDSENDGEEVDNYEYIELTYYKDNYKQLTSRQLKIGNKYLLEDNSINKLIDKNKEKLYFENDIEIKIGSQIIKETYLTLLEHKEKFKISKDANNFIKNPPEIFYYYKLVNAGIYKIKSNLDIKFKLIKLNDIPYYLLYEEYNDLKKINNKTDKIITIDMIYNVMSKLAYSKWKENEDTKFIIYEPFLADKNAIKYSLKYNIDLKEIRKEIIGIITIEHLLTINNPEIITKQIHIKKQLIYGIQNKDILLLKQYIKEVNINWGEEFDNLLQISNDLILQYIDVEDNILRKNQKLKVNLKLAISTKKYILIRKYLKKAIELNNPDFEEIINESKDLINKTKD